MIIGLNGFNLLVYSMLQIQAELEKQQDKLKELPPLPEGLTMEVAKKLTQETTQVLMEQTAQAVATIRKQVGIDSVEELRQRVRGIWMVQILAVF